MKRMGTREAINYCIENLSADVRTSGAVSFQQQYLPWGSNPEMLCVCIYSYSMLVAVLVCGNDPFPSAAIVNAEKRSVTTSRHQVWVLGAISRRWPRTLVVYGDPKDWPAIRVAHDKAKEAGWDNISADTLQLRRLRPVEGVES